MLHRIGMVIALILGLWILTACTPSSEARATIAVARPIGSATPTIEAIVEPATPLSTSVLTPTVAATTPTATPISAHDVLATAMAYQATSEAEAATLFAPTATFTPSTTFTPIPGPIWPILFSAVSCSQEEDTCDDSLYMGQRPISYMINSDGSHLTPVTEFGLPADLSRPTFSADGTRLAFLGNFSPEDKWHLFLANADGSEATDLGAGDFGDFGDIQFISEADCLHVTQFISWVPEGGINLAIEKWCAGQLQPEELETVTFPVFYQIHFSPQGDALLAYGQDSTHKAHLVVHEIGDSTQEIFSSSSEYVTGAARWLPDGEQIEFVGTGYLDPNNTITTTFNLIELDGDNLQLRLSLAATFGITEGNWPPDGEEFIFTYGHGSITPAESGLYVLDLNTGEWRQILSYFYLGSPSNIDVWQQDAGRASLLWTGLPATTHLTGLWPVSHRAVPVSQV